MALLASGASYFRARGREQQEERASSALPVSRIGPSFRASPARPERIFLRHGPLLSASFPFFVVSLLSVCAARVKSIVRPRAEAARAQKIPVRTSVRSGAIASPCHQLNRRTPGRGPARVMDPVRQRPARRTNGICWRESCERSSVIRIVRRPARRWLVICAAGLMAACNLHVPRNELLIRSFVKRQRRRTVTHAKSFPSGDFLLLRVSFHVV